MSSPSKQAKKKASKAKPKARDQLLDDAEEAKQRAEFAAAQQWLSGLNVEDIINRQLFEDAKISEIKSQFDDHKPFRFVQLKDFMGALCSYKVFTVK